MTADDIDLLRSLVVWRLRSRRGELDCEESLIDESARMFQEFAGGVRVGGPTSTISDWRIAPW